MPNYQDHLLFGAVLVLIFSYFFGPYVAYGLDVLIVSSAFILLASVFPDIDHKGSVVHKKLRAFIILLVAAIPITLAAPRLPWMVFGAGTAALGANYVFEAVKPQHRAVTHTFRFCILFSAVTGTISLVAFHTFLPAVFTFIAYLSHLVLDGTLTQL